MPCHVLAASGSALAWAAVLVVMAAPQGACAAPRRSSPPAEAAGNSAAAAPCAAGVADTGDHCMMGRPSLAPVTMIWIYPVCTDAQTDGCLDRVAAIILSAPAHHPKRRQRAD